MAFLDVRIAIRYLLKTPGFTATAVLMLALGIGATTAIFSVVEGVLLRPLPFPHPEKLVVLSDIVQGLDLRGNGESGVDPFDVQAYPRDTHSFENLGGYQQTSYELSGIGDPVNVNATRLSGGVFPALEDGPLMGRLFTQREDDEKEQVAVVSYSFWQSRLHGNSGVLGTKITLDRKPYMVIGVMPRNFEFPLVLGRVNNSELWVPMSLTQAELTAVNSFGWGYGMVGRLKPGITLAQAQSDVEPVAQVTMRRLNAFLPGFPYLGAQRSGILNLVFASAAPRLAIIGCAVGLLGAWAVSHLLDTFLFGVSPFDPLVLILAAVFVLMLALMASLLPARRAASTDPMQALRAD